MVTKTKRMERIAKGLCTSCGTPTSEKAQGSFMLCEGCRLANQKAETPEFREMVQKAKQDRRRRRAGNFLCVKCGEESPDYLNCQHCRRMMNESNIRCKARRKNVEVEWE